MSAGRIPACTWHSPSQTLDVAAGLARDVRAEPHVGAEQDLGVVAVLAEDVLHDLDRVRRRAAVVGLGLHLGGGVDVHHHDRARVLRLPGAQLVGGDRVGQRAAGVEVRDQHRLVGREDRGGLRHEVDAAEHDRVGAGLGRLAREPERVARRRARRPAPRAAGSCARGSRRCAARPARAPPPASRRCPRCPSKRRRAVLEGWEVASSVPVRGRFDGHGEVEGRRGMGQRTQVTPILRQCLASSLRARRA